MVEGMLIINLDPPYVGFTSDVKYSPLQKESCWHNSTEHEIKELLHELGVLQDGRTWPPEEYVARVPVRLSGAELERLGIRHQMK